MIKTIRSSFQILKDNLIVLQPLIFYLILFGILMQPVYAAGTFNLTTIILLFVLFMLTAAFGAGWFYIIKASVDMKDEIYAAPEDKGIAQLGLLKKFFTGVGEYFMPMIAALLLYFILIGIFVFISLKAGMHYIGPVHLSPELTSSFAGSFKDTYELFASNKVPSDVQNKLFMWNTFLSSISLLFSFLFMYYWAAIFYKTKNIFRALFLNFKFLFTHFIDSIIIIIFLSILNMITLMFSLLGSLNIIFSIISFLVIFFYITYSVTLVFTYYDEKTKDNCDNRLDSIG